MHICFISSDYPSKGRPVFTFIKELIDSIADQGIECSVIAPYSITKNKWCTIYKKQYTTAKSNIVTLYRPHYFSFSIIKLFGVSLSSLFHNWAVNFALKQLPVKPDIIYGHFWQSGLEGFRYAKTNNIPLFIASGESDIPMEIASLANTQFFDYVQGVICASIKNKKESITKGLTTDKKCVVIPNAINPNKFHLLDKNECRQKLNFAQDVFIISFVGGFIDRKGPQRLSNAINKIGDNSIYSIFIGSGSQKPNCNNILFMGSLPHEIIPYYLNASDVFVLPTLYEGCCNAIIEAMACGLPIISSNRDFNTNILDESNSITINPESVDEIANAIFLLKNNIALREKLRKGSLLKAQSLTIDQRAHAIINFINFTIY